MWSLVAWNEAVTLYKLRGSDYDVVFGGEDKEYDASKVERVLTLVPTVKELESLYWEHSKDAIRDILAN